MVFEPPKTSDSETGPPRGTACTNCGALVETRYCTRCGQKAVSLDRPALALLRDVLDGFFSLDGKFWRTVIGLYRHPGRAAREFLDGRRASNSPPVRLYVIAALVFVLGFQASGIALIGIVTSGPGVSGPGSLPAETVASAGEGPINVGIRPFRPPWAPDPQPVDWEAVHQAMLAQSERDENGDSLTPVPTQQDLLDAGGIAAMAATVGEDPLAAEQRANLALNQAILAMVILFGLYNAALHPKARLVTHAVHSLYFHAALLPLTVASSMVAVFVSAVSFWASIPFGVGGVCAALYLAWRSDRVVYGSSWYGATLRVAVLSLLYLLSFLVLAIVLILI